MKQQVLFIVSFILFSYVSMAQEVEESIELSAPKKELNEKLEAIRASVEEETEGLKSLSDSLLSELKPAQIDSLNGLNAEDLFKYLNAENLKTPNEPLQLPSWQEIDKSFAENLVKSQKENVNKIPQQLKDEGIQTLKHHQDALIGEQKEKVAQYSSNFQQAQNTYHQIQQEDYKKILTEANPTAAGQLLSIQKDPQAAVQKEVSQQQQEQMQRLKDSKYFKKQEQVKHTINKGEGYKELVLQERNHLIDHYDLLGSITLVQGKMKAFRFNPQLGFDILPRLSVGVGPNFDYLNYEELSVKQLLGLNYSVRYGVYKDNVFVKLENTTMAPNVSYLNKSEDYEEKWQHAPMLGLGFSLKDISLLPLETVIYYNLNPASPGVGYQQNWNLQLGFSF